MSLEEDLQTVDGIGPAKASEVMDVIEDHNSDSEAREQVSKALEYMDQGDYGYGEKYLRRLVE